MDRTKRLDPASLKALAHPLRVELFHALAEGPATASQLARRFDESSGATSYHLRQLARFGFIEEDLDRGDGRDRWWRTVVRGIQLDVREAGIVDHPPTRELARWYVHDVVHRAAQDAEAFLDPADAWGMEWLAASDLASTRMQLTPAQLEALRDELREVVERHRVELGDNPDPRAGRVRVVVQGFPIPEERDDTEARVGSGSGRSRDER